ncbi:MAG: radical SAM/SPASM domain-containing protein [Acidobacteriota bacterium]
MHVLRTLKSRYYVPRPEDPLPSRVWKSATRRHVPAFPRTVQIQTQTGCNAACIFCPYPDTVESQPKGFMSGELFERIVDEIARYGVRRISPYLMNEPFLDPGIIDKMSYIKAKIPEARLVLTSNASRLSPKIVERLIAADVLHALYISFQGVEKVPYEETMRGAMVFEKTMENVLHLIEKWKTAGGRDRFKIVVSMVRTNRIDVDKAVAYWRERGVESKWTPLENRGGNIAIASELTPSDHPMRRFATCTRLFKQAYILFNGDMVLCCTDYRRKVVLGNVAGSSISQVWNSEKAVAIRRLFSEGHMNQVPLCRTCEISDTDGEEEFN